MDRIPCMDSGGSEKMRGPPQDHHIPELDETSHPEKSQSGWLTQQVSSQCGCGASSLWVRALGNSATLLACWALLIALLGREALPGGGLFALAALILAAHFAGLATGLTSLPYHATGVYVDIAIALREISLAVILVQSGLSLDPVKLGNLSFAVIRLAVCPGLTEACAVAVLMRVIFGYPWLWGFSLGFLLCAISPAVVVPILLKLKKEGYGESKGISTLIIAASSIDDVLAISVYSICVGIIFSTGQSLISQVFQGPMDVVVGLASGTAWGLCCALIPHMDDELVVAKRAAMAGCAATAAVLGCHWLGFPGAGPLFAITGPFVASTAWATQGWVVDENPVTEIFSWTWVITEPIMFALIGVEIDIRVIQLNTVTWGLIIIAVSQVIRSVATSLVLVGGTFNMKEILFVNLAWLPKATVQAALAPQAVAMAASAKNPSPGDAERAAECLTFAVLSILVTAPLGAVGASLGGPRLLSKGTSSGTPGGDGETGAS